METDQRSRFEYTRASTWAEDRRSRPTATFLAHRARKNIWINLDCRCPDTTKVWQMPRELHPYKWVNQDKPIIIDDSTYQQWIKSDQNFKRMYRRADSLQRVKQKLTNDFKAPRI